AYDRPVSEHLVCDDQRSRAARPADSRSRVERAFASRGHGRARTVDGQLRRSSRCAEVIAMTLPGVACARALSHSCDTCTETRDETLRSAQSMCPDAHRVVLCSQAHQHRCMNAFMIAL